MSQGVQAGDHVCCVYQDHEEHIQIVCQFCNEGLTNNSKVLCLLADDQMVASILKNETQRTNYQVLRSSEVIDKLRESGCDVDTYLAQGQLEFYFPSSFMHNGKLLLDKLIDHLSQEVKNTSTGVWLYSDPLFHILTYGYNAQGNLSFHDFECKLNSFSQSMVLCCYDKNLFSTPFMQRAFANHPIIAAEDKYYTTNMYYMPDYDSLDDIFGTSNNAFSESNESPSVDRWISFLDEWHSIQQGKERKRKKPDEHSGLPNSFISNMSHQLHTPLTGILGASVLMATTSLSPEQEEYLAYIVSSAEQLKHVISDILDFKQLGTELTIEKQPVSLRECLNESLHQSGINTLAGSGTPGVICHVGDDVPDYIMSDRSRIVQVLVNLIHNTMRFSIRDAWSLFISIENSGFLPPSPPSTPNSPSLPSSSTLSSTTTSTSLSPPTSISPAVPPIYNLTTDDTPAAFPSELSSTLTKSNSSILSSTPSTSSNPSPSSTPSTTPNTTPNVTPTISPAATPPLTPTLKLKRFFPTRIHPPPVLSLPSPMVSPLSVENSRVHSFVTKHAHAHAHAFAGPHTQSNAMRCVLRITVRDNGAGIEPAILEDIFHPDNSLSKIKHVLELLGGDIKVESDGKGKGTTVTVTIKAEVWAPPITPSTSPSLPPSSALASHSQPTAISSVLSSRSFPSRVRPLPIMVPLKTSLSSPSLPSNPTLSASSTSTSPRGLKPSGLFKDLAVLLVEDNLMNQKVLRRLFGKLGIIPDVASHGAQAVEYIRNKKYDIVFMDLHMPVCDGFEATKQIQELPHTIHKPHIYALTASVSSDDKEKCLQLGMKGHLPKPVSVQALVDALSSVNVS